MHVLRPASPLDRADYASHRADPAASREAKSTVDSHANTRDTRQVEQDVDLDKRQLSADWKGHVTVPEGRGAS